MAKTAKIPNEMACGKTLRGFLTSPPKLAINIQPSKANKVANIATPKPPVVE